MGDMPARRRTAPYEIGRTRRCAQDPTRRATRRDEQDTSHHHQRAVEAGWRLETHFARLERLVPGKRSLIS